MSDNYDAVQDSLLRQLTDGGVSHAARRGDGPPPVVPDHELLRLIGSGSYGEVWLAKNVLGTYRAVKVVYRSRFGSARPYEREFHGMQSYEPVSRRHEGLVDILQIGRNDEAAFFYYVMELADDAAGGPPLAPPPEEVQRAMIQASRPRTTRTAATTLPEAPAEPAMTDVSPESYQPRTLSSEIRKNGRLAPAECVQAFLTLTAALSTLHRCGLLHRDIKPSNIVIMHGIPKLADIGLVAEAGAEMSFVGTEGFIPPEGPGTAAADIYALGKMFYEAFTGLDRQQFPSLPAEHGEGLSELKTMLELSAVANKACAPEAAKRYESAEEMLADLALLHSGRSVRRLRMVEKRLHRATRFGLAAAVIAVLATGTGFLLQHLRSREHEERNALEAALTEARLQRAVAERIAAKPGAGFAVLEAVTEGARSRSGDPALRAEAITALAQGDLRTVEVLTPERTSVRSFVPNATLTALAVAQADGSVRVEKPPGTPVAVASIGNMPLEPFFLGNSGRYLMIGGTDHAARLWDVKEQKVVWQSAPWKPQSRVDPLERWMVNYDHETDTWVRRDLETGAETPLEPRHDTSVAITSDIEGGRIARGSYDGRKIEVRDVATWKLLGARELPEGAAIKSLCLSADGRWLTVGTLEFRNFSFDLSDPARAPVESRLHRGAVVELLVGPDNEMIYSSAWDYSTRIIHAATGRQIVRLPAWSYSNMVSPDGRAYWRLDAQSFALHKYEMAPPVCQEFSEPPGALDSQSPNEVMWSADGSMLALSSWHGVRLLNARTGALLGYLKSGQQVSGMIFRDDGAIIMAAGGVYLWPAENKDGAVRFGNRPQELAGGYVYRMRSDRTGRMIAAATANEVRILRRDGTEFEPVEEPSDKMHGPYRVVEMSADGRWMATGTIGTARVWDTTTGKLHWKDHSDQQWMPVFSPDSRLMVGNDLKHAICYDVESKSVVWKTPLPESMGIFGAWSPDGRMVVLLRRSNALVALDAKTGEVWGEWIHPNQQLITSLAFSPDGRRLAVTCNNGIVQVWNLPLLRAGLKKCGLDFPLPEMPVEEGAAVEPKKMELVP